MALQKPSLLKQFKDIIDANIKKGAKTSEELRQGIPSIFTASDGLEYRLENVSRYYRTSTNENVKTLNPTFLDVAKNKEVTASRANALKIQTSPNVDKWDKKTDAVKGLEAHHKRGVKMYAPFYEGLNDKQAQELTQWFVDEGVPLGDAKSNLVNLPKDLHVGEEGIHTWMKENNIQVLPDKTGKGNFIKINKGKNAGKSFVKGSPGSGVRAVMPSVKHLSLNERLPAIATWLKYVQEPVDTKLAELIWEDHERKNKLKVSNKKQIPEIAKELAEENKINKLLKINKGKAALGLGLGLQGLGIFGDGYDAYAGTVGAFDKKKSKLDQSASALQGMSGGLGLASLKFPPALIPSLAAKGAELHIRNRINKNKNRYKTISDRMSNMPTDLKIRKTMPQDAVRSLELK